MPCVCVVVTDCKKREMCVVVVGVELGVERDEWVMCDDRIGERMVIVHEIDLHSNCENIRQLPIICSYVLRSCPRTMYSMRPAIQNDKGLI